MCPRSSELQQVFESRAGATEHGDLSDLRGYLIQCPRLRANDVNGLRLFGEPDAQLTDPVVRSRLRTHFIDTADRGFVVAARAALLSDLVQENFRIDPFSGVQFG